MQHKLKKKYQISCRRLLFNQSPSKEISKYIGCSPEFYRNYIRSMKFPDMTDESFGKKWQLDHIVPVELFDLEKEDDLKLCFNYLNILPMYSFDNKSKGMSIHFSEILLRRMNKSPIVDKLLEVCQTEISTKYDKYLLSSRYENMNWSEVKVDSTS